MLAILGRSIRLCDRLRRRDFLTIGSLAMGGCALPDLLRAEQVSQVERSHKAIIMIYLTGGPSHLDMVDLKPNAPLEYRGELQPISTNVPGIQISELMPRVAGMMDKFALIRSLVGSDGQHTSAQCVTGRPLFGQPPGGWPEIGCVLSRLQGSVDPSVPPAIDLSMKMKYLPYNLPGAGFLGGNHEPFKPTGAGLKDMVLSDISLDRLSDRKSLLRELGNYRRRVERALPSDVNEYTRRAFDILTSNKIVEALDLSREDARVRERYGQDDPKVLPYSASGYQAHMSKFLAARRLVEAGARCVTVAFADFDWHSNNFPKARKVIPLLDQGISALVTDLHERGLDKDVTVIVWGEFGRTPRINRGAGRDHWSAAAFALLAGGGMPTGQVIGATDYRADSVIERPVSFSDVFATLYHNMGIDLTHTTLSDLSGRPHYLCDSLEPIRELM